MVVGFFLTWFMLLTDRRVDSGIDSRIWQLKWLLCTSSWLHRPTVTRYVCQCCTNLNSLTTSGNHLLHSGSQSCASTRWWMSVAERTCVLDEVKSADFFRSFEQKLNLTTRVEKPDVFMQTVPTGSEQTCSYKHVPPPHCRISNARRIESCELSWVIPDWWTREDINKRILYARGSQTSQPATSWITLQEIWEPDRFNQGIKTMFELRFLLRACLYVILCVKWRWGIYRVLM